MKRSTAELAPVNYDDDGAPMRTWLSGVVVLEPWSSSQQGQRFANWAASKLTYQVGSANQPPRGYTGVEYEIRPPTPSIPER